MNRIDGTFDVVGAHAALAYFGRLEPARLGHGYLFTGPEGVGKKTFGSRLAQSLLCETPKATLLGYCGSCAGCKLFAAGTHPDFISSVGRIKIGGDDGDSRSGEPTARDLVRDLSLHGYRSRFRVVLLGDVAFATHEAANALLKFFEEPPSGVVLVLTTDSPGSLIATVRSRFLEFAFGPLSRAEVERVLVSEGVTVERARFAADVALGSVTRARAVLDDEAGVRAASYAWFASAVRGEQPDSSFLNLDDRSSNAGEKRAAVADLIEIVRSAARDWVALGTAGPGVPVFAADQRALFEALPPREPNAYVSLLAGVADAQRLSRTNVSAGLVLDFLRLQLAPSAR